MHGWRPLKRPRRILLATAFSLLLAACGSDSPALVTPANALPTAGSTLSDVSVGALTDISGIEELRAQFTEDDGSARLVLLLSPT